MTHKKYKRTIIKQATLYECSKISMGLQSVKASPTLQGTDGDFNNVQMATTAV